jgi:dTDP-4-dehydrorhamnose reductase
MPTPGERWALLGSRGQLGQDLLHTLAADVVALPRTSIDLTRPETIAPVLTALRPRVVINCAAYNLVDQAESEPAIAFTVNALAVRELARCCRDLDCTLVHFSTDQVFGLDESRSTPYRETDAPGPVNCYGTSKLAGEYFIRAICPKHLIIRTCGLYGRRGLSTERTNFVERVLQRAATGAEIRVVHDQRCTPTSTADLAPAVAALVTSGATGLFHVTSAGDCNWFEFAQAVIAEAGITGSIKAISSADYGAAARRPHLSMLDCSKYDDRQLVNRRPWRAALHEYLQPR